MSMAALGAALVNYIITGLLPRLFFRSDGTFNIRWWATAAPFFILPGFLLAAHFLGLPPIWTLDQPIQDAVATVLFSISTGFIGLTVGTNRVPLALWHQNNDAPRNIVTFGAYRYIRHPFYTSFLLAALASFILFPHYFTLANLVYMGVALNTTAAREEKRLSTSEFGSEYREYLKRTGRFFFPVG